jgi:hypothetical protein
MRRMAAREIAEPKELSADEFRALLERRIRRRFGMTLVRFVEAIEAGELDDDPAATEFAMLVGAHPSPV